ncbi:MAG: T9SS type A sorting domain-containing protein [Candidatus Latescibacteria bacterium]|nr:T9SS type A sorting domain-containing protein [Candidatus Latescibacterota bacterium]
MKKVRVYLVFLIICLIAGSLYAQETWKNFTTDNGLPANEIRAIAEETNGIKWFGTEGGGVAKLDGDTWTVYDEKDGLVYNKARELVVDKDGILWVGTPRGVSSFDGKTWTTYTTENSGLASNHITSIEVSEDNVKWFGTNGGGLVRYDGKTFTTQTKKDGLVDDYIYSLKLQDKEIWVGTALGVSKYDGTTWKTYTMENSGLPSNLITSIHIDDDGVVWLGTGSGVARFSNDNWEVFSARTLYDILDTRMVLSITRDKDNILWCGTSTGLWSFDGDHWQGYTKFDSELKNDSHFWSIYEDAQGTKWFGTANMLTSVNSKAEPLKKSSAPPLQMKITGNYPNPFNPSTTIEFYIPDSGQVGISVYNITGQKIKTLLAREMPAGSHTIVWNGKDDNGVNVASGIYFFRMQAGKEILNHRMMLVK